MRAWILGCGVAVIGLGSTAASAQILVGGVGGDCPDFTASCPAVYDPVVCSDGNTYSNLCEATVWGCATDCVPTGGGVFALGLSDAVSASNGANPGDELGRPDAPSAIRIGGGGGCPDFTAACPAVYDPVVCSDGNTYPNLCAATVWGCATGCVPTGGGVVALVLSDGQILGEASAANLPDDGSSGPALIQIGGGGGCPDFTAMCPDVYAAVLCEDGNVYPNACAASVWGCQTDCTPTGGGVFELY